MINRYPPLFPMPHAVNYGEDQYGLFQDFDIKGVTLRMRWIPPGEYCMGSLGDEEGRRESEYFQPVVIDDGFWLAETTTPQALWLVVFRKNPSKFRGKDLPVDSVSWNDCQEFLMILGNVLYGFEWRLPTETEWEYACRAGTSTRFSFGYEIDLNQCNYNGKWDSFSFDKVALKKTVSVNAFKPNSFGLYQMHGNVWEWCSTESREQCLAQQRDFTVKGSINSDVHEYVLRGGSWRNDGRRCRSAYRGDCVPDRRPPNFGFRLALSQELK